MTTRSTTRSKTRTLAPLSTIMAVWSRTDGTSSLHADAARSVVGLLPTPQGGLLSGSSAVLLPISRPSSRNPEVWHSRCYVLAASHDRDRGRPPQRAFPRKRRIKSTRRVTGTRLDHRRFRPERLETFEFESPRFLTHLFMSGSPTRCCGERALPPLGRYLCAKLVSIALCPFHANRPQRQ